MTTPDPKDREQERDSYLRRNSIAFNRLLSMFAQAFGEEGMPDAPGAIADAFFYAVDLSTGIRTLDTPAPGNAPDEEAIVARLRALATPMRGSEEVGALEDAIAGAVGRNWCPVCESYDHDCGCDPDVNRRKLADILDRIRAALRTHRGTEQMRRDHEAMEALRNGVAGQVWYGGLRASTPGSTKWHAERHDVAMTTADDPADAILATPTGETE